MLVELEIKFGNAKIILYICKKIMLKQRDLKITKTISFHSGEEAMWYITPTIGFQRIDWAGIIDKKEITYMFVIKWLKGSVGIIKRYY